ncbi:MAG: hypothetical protein NVS4B2_30140 [Chloroflexota bacterium]
MGSISPASSPATLTLTTTGLVAGFETVRIPAATETGRHVVIAGGSFACLGTP